MTARALEMFRRTWAADTPELAMEKAAKHTTADFASFAPIDPRAVATRFGATVTYQPAQRGPNNDLTEHGQLTVVDGRWHVRVPLQMSGERRRFSVAHELGHILLFTAVADHPDLVKQLRSQELFTRVERLCNIGAAHILMPTVPFLAALNEQGTPDRHTVETLASHFHVSLETAARRVTEVAPEWSLVIWEYSTQHRKGPAWRIAKQPQRAGAVFVPDGMSSGRLEPDIVTTAARDGDARAAHVSADIPGVATMEDVRAWHVVSLRKTLVDIGDERPQYERVFVFYKQPNN